MGELVHLCPNHSIMGDHEWMQQIKGTASKTHISAELEFMPQCHTLQHTDVVDTANMQNRSGCFEILELRPEMP